MPDEKPLTQQLWELGRKCKRLAIDFNVDTAPGFTEIKLDLRTKGFASHLDWFATRHAPQQEDTGVHLPGPSNDLDNTLAQLGKALAGAPIVWESVKVSSSGSPIKGPALKQLVTGALQENFTGGAQTSSWGAQNAAALAAIRAGDVSRWNALTSTERQAAGPFRRLDLRGLNLDGIDLTGDIAVRRITGLDFEESDFSNASLVKAQATWAIMNHCQLERADLSRADLRDVHFHSANLKGARLAGADLRRAKLRRANLAGADLSDTQLDAADFCGADLTGAVLSGARAGFDQDRGTRYDDDTRFPDGFSPSAGWLRAETER